ncbi:MAG: Ldh family oxidoreductase [Caldilineaceae bacterium]|nr:Ldh family oxidoreductase [Caldilineaceae bacterium]
MLTIAAQELRQALLAIFVAAGAPLPVAKRIAASLVESNLVGHDSHGVLRVPEYIERIRAGTLQLNGEITLVHETASTALVDCQWNLGQVALPQGMEIALTKARATGIGMVVLGHCDHTGRVGEYVVHAAEQDMIGQLICNGSLPGGIVAPFGGARRALGANPIAWALPLAERPPLFFDFATSAVAHGKLQVAADKGELVPIGWIIDKTGQPTRNPQDQFDDGAILPFGGHKGYALSVMIELLGGGLSGAGFPLLPGYRWDQGTVLTAIDIAAFQPIAAFKAQATAFVNQLKAIPCAPGVDEILLPGEVEWRTKATRDRDGIPLPVVTWQRITAAAQTVGVTL